MDDEARKQWALLLGLLAGDGVKSASFYPNGAPQAVEFFPQQGQSLTLPSPPPGHDARDEDEALASSGFRIIPNTTWPPRGEG